MKTDQRVFTDLIIAKIQADRLSEDGKFYSVVDSNNFLVIEGKNPVLQDYEILISVHLNGEQVDWGEL